MGLGFGGDPDTLFLFKFDIKLETFPPTGVLGPLASLGPRTADADCAEPVLLIVALPEPSTMSSGGEGLRDPIFVGDGLADPPMLVRLCGVGGITDVTGGGRGTAGLGARGGLGTPGSSEDGSTNRGLGGGGVSSSSSSGGGSLNIGRGGWFSISGGGSLNDGREGCDKIVGGGGGGGVRTGGGGGGGGVWATIGGGGGGGVAAFAMGGGGGGGVSSAAGGGESIAAGSGRGGSSGDFILPSDGF